jgi:hypothetical protein
MKLVLLSGQSLSNKVWIEDVRNALSPMFDETEIMYYTHWKNGGEIADVEIETEKFIKIIDSISGDYQIFAKSIGSVIFLNSLSKLNKAPVTVTLVGIPYHMALQNGYDFAQLKKFTRCPIHVYQKLHDPHCAFEDLKHIAGGLVTVNEYQCINEPNSDHHYASMETLKGLL